MSPSQLPSRIRRRIAQVGDCWLWTGHRVPLGYGQVHWQRKDRASHRVVYELLVGPIPQGLELDHLCRVPPCVNPDHLEPVTHRENMRRGTSPAAHALRFNECIHGHELTPENTYRPSTEPNRRMCRTCLHRRSAEWRRRRKAA